jgi:hypothetical protein
MANVVSTNLVEGPANLWIGVFGATEPADTVAGLTVDPATGWTFAGGTTDGVTLTISQGYKKLRVDQVADNLGARMNERDFTVETNLAEPTLENLAWALNQAQSTVAAGTGVKTLDLGAGDPGAIPQYAALIIDGYAPQASSGTATKRRRVIVRKVISDDDVEFAYQSDDQTVYSVRFSGFWVSSSIKPVHIVDET